MPDICVPLVRVAGNLLITGNLKTLSGEKGQPAREQVFVENAENNRDAT
jgi:hypothetical protein